MKVAMVLIKKPYRSTRALKPFYVTERDAKVLQLINKARIAGPEDFEAYDKEKKLQSNPSQEKLVETQIAFVDEPETQEISTEEVVVKRGRGRPRKVRSETETIE